MSPSQSVKVTFTKLSGSVKSTLFPSSLSTKPGASCVVSADINLIDVKAFNKLARSL